MKKKKGGKDRCDQTKNYFKLNDSQWGCFNSRALPLGFYSKVTVILDELLCYVMTLNWEHVNIAKDHNRTVQSGSLGALAGKF